MSYFFNPMDWSLPGSSVEGILQAGILEWVAMPSSRGSSWPRGRNHVSYVYLYSQAGFFFTTSANWEARGMMYILQNEVTKVLTHEVNCRAMIYSQPGLFPITLLSLSPRVGPLYRLQWWAEVATCPFHRALPLCPGQTERRCLLKGCLTYFMDFLRIIFIIFYF